MMYRICSGQSRKRGAPDWGICLADDKYQFCPWWRAESADGRRRLTYRTPEQAERKRLELEKQRIPARLLAELRRAAANRARAPKAIDPVPYSTYFVTSCLGCHIDGKAPLRAHKIT